MADIMHKQQAFRESPLPEAKSHQGTALEKKHVGPFSGCTSKEPL